LTPILKRWQTVAVVAGAKEGGGQCCKQVVLLVNGEHGRKKAQTESVRRQLKEMQRKVDGSKKDRVCPSKVSSCGGCHGTLKDCGIPNRGFLSSRVLRAVKNSNNPNLPDAFQLKRGNSTMQLRRIKSGENYRTSCSFHGRPPCQYIIHILGHQPDGCLFFFFLKILLPASLTYLFFQHSVFHETINVRTLDSVFHAKHHNGFPFHRCLSSWQHKMHKKKCKK
jgi:hypothetical protein